jgi:phosphoribosylamine-glycine ligase
LTKNGPKVLEFNCRLGDPETQPLMMMLKSDLCKILLSIIDGTLHKQKLIFKKGAAVCVVLTSAGYPGNYQKGEIIHGLRKEKKITLLELSEKSGVALATLSRIENGKMTGTLKSHMNICKTLEIDITGQVCADTMGTRQ